MKSSLNESIISIRVKLQSSKIKKSGKNKFAGFDYYELSDFLPTLNELMKEEGVNDIFTIDENIAKLILIKGEERQEYSIPFKIFDTPLTNKKDKNGNFLKDKNGDFIQVPSMQDIQYLGALNTYYKRYLYLNAFGITDGEVIDNMNNDDLEAKEQLDYKNMLEEYIQDNNLDKVEICKKYKLNARSKAEAFRTAYIDLINQEVKADAS